ncbi:MAG: serine/threonine protein kinase [Planctomycetes bacterium]|nr:serine/threonine protein kinase [Planctomycetota bacterium]
MNERSTDSDAGVLAPGALLADRFRIVAPLGRGAMGAVYRARDERLGGADVAIKTILAERLGDRRTVERFLAETRTLARLQDPRVVRVLDCGLLAGDRPFLVMELLDGTDLLGIVTEVEDPLDLAAWRTAAGGIALRDESAIRLIVRWGAELAEGLQHCHEVGVVHRDLKPSNVFVRRDGSPVLIDFGLAWREDAGSMTLSDELLGTPAYMAPERLDPQAPTLPSADVWALGAVLHHLLRGMPPYVGTPSQIFVQLLRDDPPPLDARLPRDLRAIVDRALERDVARRYPSMAAMASDLRAFLDHRPVTARPLGRVGRLRRWCRRRPARAVATAAVAATAALAAVALPLVLDARARARDREYADLDARLPALLAFEGDPEQRLIAELTPERDTYLATLDRMLELRPDRPAPRLWRAALQLDQGRRDEAAADLRALAAGGSAYLGAVAARYARAAQGERGVRAVDLSELGVAPSSATDLLVAGFHELRERRDPDFGTRALPLLTAAAEQGSLVARDLRLIALVNQAERQLERRDPGATDTLHEAILESARLAQTYGRETARTLAIRGVAYVMLGDYAAALEPLEQSLALRHDRHGPHQNLGVALYRLHRLDDAVVHLEEARALRPWLANTDVMLAQVYRDRGRDADAFAAVDRILGRGDRNAQKAAMLGVNIALMMAREAAAAHDAAGLDRALAEATRRREDARHRGLEDYAGDMDADLALIHSLRDADWPGLRRGMLELLYLSEQQRQRDPWLLRDVARLLRADEMELDERQGRLLLGFVAQLSTGELPGDSALRDELAGVITAADAALAGN